MITHVAEAGEDRGRVVLKLGAAGKPHEVAIEAAVRLAQAFQSEIESLFIEDQQLYDLARFPFAREISFSGRSTRALSTDDIEREMLVHSAALQRRVLAAAELSHVRARSRIVRDEPVRALAMACAEKGPWNVVTLGEVFGRNDGLRLLELFHVVEATTGFVLAGPKARRTGGPVVALVEEVERVPGMLRAAERIASVTGSEPRLWLIEDGRERLDWLEGQVRLSLGLKAASVKLECIDMATCDVAGLAGKLSQAGAGFTIARYDGRLAPGEDGALPIAGQLEGPLFLVR